MAAEDVEIGDVREPLSSIAVIIVYLYMLIFTMFRAFTDNDEKDEDFIDCTCRDSDHAFYTAMVYLFSVIWGICVIGWLIIRIISRVCPRVVCPCFSFEKPDKPDVCKIVMSVIMEPLSCLAHLAVLPLLFVQFLSTYAWICITGDKYCREDVSPNQLEIDRSSIIIGFFVSAAVIGFTARMTSATK